MIVQVLDTSESKNDIFILQIMFLINYYLPSTLKCLVCGCFTIVLPHIIVAIFLLIEIEYNIKNLIFENNTSVIIYITFFNLTLQSLFEYFFFHALCFIMWYF